LLPFKTRETVPIPTPALTATSAMVLIGNGPLGSVGGVSAGHLMERHVEL
jgi:hypothetical protein